MDSILLLYLHSPPPVFHSTIVSILLLFLNFPPPSTFHYTIVSILLLYLNFPPCVPPKHGLHYTSLCKLPPPCVPLNHCLHSTSLFKLPPLRSTKPWSPFYFFISTSPPPAFHQTMVSILLLYLNFPPCVPLNHSLHSTSLFKLSPLHSTKPWSPFYFFI